MSSNSPSKRRPGAPFGNTNALKHGYYASKLRLAAAEDVDGILVPGLNHEIGILRDLIQSVASRSGEVQDFDGRLAIMRGLSLALVSLARLLRTQHFLEKDSRDDRSVISELLNIALDELGMGGSADSPAPSPN